MSKFDETPNGHKIIATRMTPGTAFTRPGRVILAEAPEDRFHKFVTAWQGEGDYGWHDGQYSRNYEQAYLNFTKRS